MIGILTFYWADDYGALLQAYALKYYLEKTSDKEVVIIPYSPVRLSGRYWLFPIIASQDHDKIKYFLYRSRFYNNLCHFPVFIKRKWNMRIFRHKHLTGKSPVRNGKKISLEKYSFAFIGSDQVWNPEITVGLDDVYTGNISRKGNCKLIAYAASLGSDKLPLQYSEKFATAVRNNFYAISLREKTAVPFVESLLNRSVTNVLDPTLLLEKQEWINAGREISARGYILFVSTEMNGKMLESLHALARKTGKKIIQLMPFVHNNTADSVETHIECGPAEYIGYFQNADYVITNSFHGMAFSVIFEKQFWVFSHSSKNARLESLLKKLNLESRLIKPENEQNISEIDTKIDWKTVRILLEKEKKISFGFIDNILQTSM